jgi:thiol-disulfide isomerase/thioredoxin
MPNNAKIFVSVVGILILGTIATAMVRSNGSNVPAGPGKYDTFAQCLKDNGATFYGAWWCPHCQAQKKLFGSSQKLLPYVECYVYPDTNNSLPVCLDKNITSYPTWELKDGTRLAVENSAGVTLETLAEKTSCELPQ